MRENSNLFDGVWREREKDEKKRRSFSGGKTWGRSNYKGVCESLKSRTRRNNGVVKYEAPAAFEGKRTRAGISSGRDTKETTSFAARKSMSAPSGAGIVAVAQEELLACGEAGGNKWRVSFKRQPRGKKKGALLLQCRWILQTAGDDLFTFDCEKTYIGSLCGTIESCKSVRVFRLFLIR